MIVLVVAPAAIAVGDRGRSWTVLMLVVVIVVVVAGYLVLVVASPMVPLSGEIEAGTDDDGDPYTDDSRRELVAFYCY